MGSNVIVIGDTPYPPSPVYQCVAEHPDDIQSCGFPLDAATNKSAIETQSAAITALGGNIIRAGTDDEMVASSAPSGDSSPAMIDMTDYICPPATTASCPAVIGNALVYRQGSHITATYVETMTDAVRRALEAAGMDLG